DSWNRLLPRQQLAQYEMQNPAIPIVSHFPRRIDADDRCKRLSRAIGFCRDHVNRLAWSEVRQDGGEAIERVDFLAGETEGVRVFARLELQGENPHADEVGAVDAFEALGDDDFDAE